MKFYYIIFIIFFNASMILSSTLPEKIAIFPYRIDFQIKNFLPHSETELPLLFQDATIFLGKLIFQYDFMDSYEILNNYQEYKEGLDDLTAKIRTNQICNKELFAYFIVGEAYFYSKDIVQIKQYLYSCKTQQKLYSTISNSKWEELQKNLRNNLSKLIPFLPENYFYKNWISKTQKEKQIFVLIDQSGSMEILYPSLKEILNPESMSLYGIQRNQNLKPIKNLNELHGAGEIQLKDLLSSLSQIKKELIPFESELWILFDSFSNVESKYLKELGLLLKEIAIYGVDIKIFQTYKTNIDKWKELENFRTFQNVKVIPIKYGRTCGYSNGFRRFFVREGSQIYLCKEELENEYVKGILDLKECQIFEIYYYTLQELDLDFICTSFERKNKIQLVYASPVVTNLSTVIRKSQKNESNEITYKVLLKDEASTFWLRLTEKHILNQIMDYKIKNEGFYIGISFYKSFNTLQNITNKILFLSQKDVPKLFINNFETIKNQNSIDPEDIHIFWVKVLDIRYE